MEKYNEKAFARTSARSCYWGADCALFAASGMEMTNAMIFEALLFWTAVGWVIHVVDMKVPNVIKGGVISLFLNSPWIVEYVGIQGMSDMLMPMIIVGTVFGIIAGFVSGWIKSKFLQSTAEFAKG